MTAAVPVALAGDGLEVPCADGSQRRYLSFDAAAATGALPSVIDAVQAFVPWYACAQGAAGYKSQASAISHECARLAALAFADRGTASDDAVLFCGNATEAICHLAARLRFSRDDIVITTVAEHQANVLPWSRVASCRYIECSKDGTFDTEDVVAALGQWPRAALLAITGASGITGWMPPLPDRQFGVDPYLSRLLGLTSGEARRLGAVRASAGLNATGDDVRRLLAAVADVAAGDPPVSYHRDPSTGDFFPAAGTFPERAA